MLVQHVPVLTTNSVIYQIRISKAAAELSVPYWSMPYTFCAHIHEPVQTPTHQQRRCHHIVPPLVALDASHPSLSSWWWWLSLTLWTERGEHKKSQNKLFKLYSQYILWNQRQHTARTVTKRKHLGNLSTKQLLFALITLCWINE